MVSPLSDISMLVVKYLPRPLDGMLMLLPCDREGRAQVHSSWGRNVFLRKVRSKSISKRSSYCLPWYKSVGGGGYTLGYYSALDILGPLASCFSMTVNFSWMPVSSSLTMSYLLALICSFLKSFTYGESVLCPGLSYWERQLAILKGFPQMISTACLEPPIWWFVHVCHPLLSFYFRLLNI